ncbi:MAG: dihydrofolate reductase family protein [Gordonia sp. (in: high G+C Gram-positive bacteria)]|uniref:dihydrofolate reductase family protein n=1 Tax=Gordonia sp. (in: high G+C Gram-positive bacteria) TaxID=84139 RepID=UPI0039E574BC
MTTKVHFYTAMTLDGFLADPDDSLDWLLRQPEQDPAGFGAYDPFIANIGAIVMGRETYDWVVRHLERSGEKWPYDMPAWVMTTREPAPFPDGDIRFASGGIRGVYDEMAAAANGKDIWVVGGGDLAGQFADEGLLDEIHVSIAPVTLGAGKPLLPRRYDLELLDTARNGPFVCARYRFLGPLAEDGRA